MNLAIIGASGAGKGTQAAFLAEHFRLTCVSTGDLLRDHLRHHTPLGLLIRQHLDRGALVPDEIVDGMIRDWCDRLAPEQGVLFDGFPRTGYQARFIDALLAAQNRVLDAVIYLHLSDEEIALRLAGRLVCDHCRLPYHQRARPPKIDGVCDACGAVLHRRPDDAPGVLQQRLRGFHRTSHAVLNHYAAAGRLAIVSGAGTIEQVEDRLHDALGAIRGRTFRFATADQVARFSRHPEPRIARPDRATSDWVLLGGPGSGKGTQGEMLAREFGLTHLATGDLFRENLRHATRLGLLAQSYMDAGELVPDDVTEAMVEERLGRTDVQHGFILDGFPRTLPQAHALTEMLNRLHRHLTGVLHLAVPDATILARLAGRLTCRHCSAAYHTQFRPPKKAGVCDACGHPLYQRPDDNPSTIAARIAAFHDQTAPLIAFYRESGLLRDVDGAGSPAAVQAQCLAPIREAQSRASSGR